MRTEAMAKAIVYACAAVVAAALACNMAHCHNVFRILWDQGNSFPGMLARFYFIVLMGIAVIVTQNYFIRKALRAKRADEAHGNGA